MWKLGQKLAFALLATASLGGCITQQMVENGGVPTSRRPPTSNDPWERNKQRHEACKQDPNTDAYLDCLAKYDRGETNGGTVHIPFPQKNFAT